MGWSFFWPLMMSWEVGEWAQFAGRHIATSSMQHMRGWQELWKKQKAGCHGRCLCDLVILGSAGHRPDCQAATIPSPCSQRRRPRSRASRCFKTQKSASSLNWNFGEIGSYGADYFRLPWLSDLFPVWSSRSHRKSWQAWTDWWVTICGYGSKPTLALVNILAWALKNLEKTVGWLYVALLSPKSYLRFWPTTMLQKM